MITNHEYSDAALFMDERTDKQVVISIKDKADLITNDLLYDDGIILEESLCSDNQLRFGSCEANQIKIKMSATAVNYSLKGMTIYVRMYLAGHTSNLLDIGTYTVDSDEKNADTDERVLTCYDELKTINEADVSAWYETLFPNDDSTKTIKQIRTSFFAYFGITEQEIILPNDSMVVKKTYGLPLSGGQVIRDLCEANGVFGHISRTGIFKYINVASQTTPLYPSDDLYPSNTLYPSDGFNRIMSAASGDGGYYSGEFENFDVQKITQLEILSEAGDIGQSIGSGDNIYTIDNAMFYGMTAADLSTYGAILLDAIKNTTYTPFSMECLGSPCYEVGDGIICQTYNGILKSYILRRTLSGVQSLLDEYSALGEAVYTKDLGSIRSSVERLSFRANILRRDVDQTISEIYNEQGISRITQNANSITAEVSARRSEDGVLSSRISQNATNISLCVKKDTDYSGIVISTNGVKITSTAGTYVVDSTNFKVDENGNVTASNVDLTGKITATSGKIGALTIENGWLTYKPNPNSAGRSVLSARITLEEDTLTFGSDSWSTVVTGADLMLTCGHNVINLESLTGALRIVAGSSNAGIDIHDGTIEKKCKWVKIGDLDNEDPNDYVMVGEAPYSP